MHTTDFNFNLNYCGKEYRHPTTSMNGRIDNHIALGFESSRCIDSGDAYSNHTTSSVVSITIFT